MGLCLKELLLCLWFVSGLTCTQDPALPEHRRPPEPSTKNHDGTACTHGNLTGNERDDGNPQELLPRDFMHNSNREKKSGTKFPATALNSAGSNVKLLLPTPTRENSHGSPRREASPLSSGESHKNDSSLLAKASVQNPDVTTRPAVTESSRFSMLRDELPCNCSGGQSCVSDDLGRSYHVFDLPSINNLSNLSALVDYVDANVCLPDGHRAGIETTQELGFLISCLLCNKKTQFGDTHNKTNILTAGFVKVTTDYLNASSVLDHEFGDWWWWGGTMAGGVPSEAVLVNPKSGVAEAAQEPVPVGVYGLLLMGNLNQSCDPGGDTYRTWGLLSYKAAYLPGHVLCEHPVNVTTAPPTPAHGTSSSVSATMTSSKLTTPQDNLPTVTKTSTTTTTTPKLPVTDAGCCQLQQGGGWLCPGQQEKVPCPPGYNGWMILTCDGDRLRDGDGPSLEVDRDGCLAQWIDIVDSMVDSGNYSAGSIVQQVRNNTDQDLQLTHTDLTTLLEVLSNLTNLLQHQIVELEDAEDRVVTVQNYTHDLVSAVGNILSVPQTWDSLDKEDAGQLGPLLLSDLEVTGFILAQQVVRDHQVFLDPQVNMTVLSVPRSELADAELFFPGSESATFLHLPEGFQELLPEGEQQARLVGLLVEREAASRALPALLSRNVSYASYKEVNSPVVSMSLHRSGQTVSFTSLGEGVILRFQHAVKESGPAFRDLYRAPRPGEVATPVPGTANCVFWDNAYSGWAPDGCELLNTTLGETFCRCWHLTMIAIITDIHNHVGRDSSLDTLGTVLTSASCVSLIIAFCIFQFCKSLDSPRTAITKQLCVTLGVSHLHLLLLLDRDFLKLSEMKCEASAVVLHYWVTSGLCWMLAEGTHLYQTVQHVLSPKHFMPAYWLLGYGVPAVVVTLTLLVAYGSTSWARQDAYAPEGSEYCWLSTERGYIWAFTGPLVVVIVVNTVCMILALRSAATLKANKQKTLPQQIKLWVKGCFSLNCILGITWVFGFLYLNTGHFFAYVFTIFNASQGIMILVFHCLVNNTVRSALLARLPETLSRYLLSKASQEPPLTSSVRRAWGYPRQEASSSLSIQQYNNGYPNHQNRDQQQASSHEHYCDYDEDQLDTSWYYAIDRQHHASDRQHRAKDRQHNASDRQHPAKDRQHNTSDCQQQHSVNNRQHHAKDRQHHASDREHKAIDRQHRVDDRQHHHSASDLQYHDDNCQHCANDRRNYANDHQHRTNDRQHSSNDHQHPTSDRPYRPPRRAVYNSPARNKRTQSESPSYVRDWCVGCVAKPTWEVPATTLCTTANRDLSYRTRCSYRVAPPVPLKMSPRLTQRNIRAASQASNATQFSYISDLSQSEGPSSDSSSGRRTSVESSTSEDSSSTVSLSTPTHLLEAAPLPGALSNLEASSPCGFDEVSGGHDNPRYVPDFDTIEESDERSPRSENAVAFFP